MNNDEPLHLDLRHEEIPCDMRHLLVITAWEQLPAGEHFTVIVDHDPAPLRWQMQRMGGTEIKWTALCTEPGLHEIQIARKG